MQNQIQQHHGQALIMGKHSSRDTDAKKDDKNGPQVQIAATRKDCHAPSNQGDFYYVHRLQKVEGEGDYDKHHAVQQNTRTLKYHAES